MIQTGAELTDFITGLNGGATINSNLLSVLVSSAKAIVEEERSWMVLRKTNSLLGLTTANTWQTPVYMTSITDFSRFYGENVIRLFDGNNRIEYYRQVPLDRRLEFKNVSNTFCFDEASKLLYFNGVIPFSGTLYINYVATSTEIDLASVDPQWTTFPARFMPILAFYAIGIHKGAVDYDSINKLMLPTNAAVLQALKNALEKWDNERQASAIDGNDPSESAGGFRSGAINRE